jgi:hypothetical protein
MKKRTTARAAKPAASFPSRATWSAETAKAKLSRLQLFRSANHPQVTAHHLMKSYLSVASAILTLAVTIPPAVAQVTGSSLSITGNGTIGGDLDIGGDTIVAGSLDIGGSILNLGTSIPNTPAFSITSSYISGTDEVVYRNAAPLSLVNGPYTAKWVWGASAGSTEYAADAMSLQVGDGSVSLSLQGNLSASNISAGSMQSNGSEVVTFATGDARYFRSSTSGDLELETGGVRSIWIGNADAGTSLQVQAGSATGEGQWGGALFLSSGGVSADGSGVNGSAIYFQTAYRSVLNGIPQTQMTLSQYGVRVRPE